MTDESPPRARRADAQRNITAIVDAAIRVFSTAPDARMADVAAAAGVGRVTVYAHFPSRPDLLRAVVARAMAEGDEALSAVDTSGDPRDALGRLIAASWQQIGRIGAVATAALDVLDDDELRRLHEAPAARVLALVRRGRSEGVFRTDLPEDWLVAVLRMIMQGASVEVESGRLRAEDAADTITATVLGAYTAR
ncbi:TetR/AcrR family transcriptional regulator [Microbacterium sp. NPDC057659]|uniref:TetR/AcrR family transcriptional regulator n=1 Tax=Microbacterium sp. NPDC057659 TaxID=3346198 RepID=UPI00366B28FC